MSKTINPASVVRVTLDGRRLCFESGSLSVLATEAQHPQKGAATALELHDSAASQSLIRTETVWAGEPFLPAVMRLLRDHQPQTNGRARPKAA